MTSFVLTGEQGTLFTDAAHVTGTADPSHVAGTVDAANPSHEAGAADTARAASTDGRG
ncbi:hypothetical protein AB0E10_10755 [Streptomyces sp. NPDC048045]|uniref:hypothetical protein n=1 Tax=Streptomyces sp. NPDC048045 TaxID=3154710 RepID=UPI003431A484